MKTIPARWEDTYKKRYDRFRKLLIFWTLFIGIGAVAGSTLRKPVLSDGSGQKNPQ